MRPIRRSDLMPRVEMTPLIDVIFLLLTFFIYSLVLMVRVDVLPVTLTGVTTGEAAEPATIAALTIDRAGQLFLNREPISPEQLDAQLATYAAADDPPQLFVAMEEPEPQDALAAPAEPAGSAVAAPASVDRGPLLIGLIERLREAGLTDFRIVGPRAGGGAAP